MPTTRALAARNRIQRQTEQPTSRNEAGSLVKGCQAERLSCTVHSSQSKPNKASFSRTTSLPIIKLPTGISTPSTWTETCTLTPSDASTKPSADSDAEARSIRHSLSSSSNSAASRKSRNISLRSGRGGDGSDGSDEEEDARSSYARRARLGGCSRLSEAQPTRDDSNKENIAPVRPQLSLRNLQRDSAAQQQDSLVRQTRSRAAAPMSDRSDASSIGTSSRASCRAIRRSVSSPSVVVRKRGRTSDSSTETSSDGQRPYASRPRLDRGTDTGSCAAAPAAAAATADDMDSCYVSSQATSIFDSASATGDDSSPLSRYTTPELVEMDESMEETAKDVQQDAATINGGDRDTVKVAATEAYANVFVHARALLRYGTTADVHIVGRERERGALQRFLQKRFDLFAHMEQSAMPDGDARCSDLDGATDSGSLYVCGLPGTGKTALIRSVLSEVQKPVGIATRKGDKRPRVAFVDCMTIQHPRELFRRILEALHENTILASLSAGDAGDAEAEQLVTTIVKDTKQRTLIVLDEIDYLIRSRVHQNVLYRLFSWPQPDRQGCALIGIANSLDLTERFVPLLASKGAAPALLHFRPFEAEEIKSVIGARLALLRPRYDGEDTADVEEEDDESTAVPLFVPTAFELVARKIAAATGDLRKALDASRLAVEAVEAEAGRATTAADPFDLRHYTPQSAPKIMPSHVLKVLSAVLGSPQLTKVRSLGLQSKLVLLAMLVAQKRAGSGQCVLGGGSGSGSGSSRPVGVCASDGRSTLMCDVESTYTTMLKNDDFAKLESSELLDVMEGLEVEGMVHAVPGSGPAISARSNSHAATSFALVGSVSPSAKRAAKRQLLASHRRMQLTLSTDEILRGITTTAPAVPSSALQVGECSRATAIGAEAIKRVWLREQHNSDRAKGWESLAKDAQRVRDEELGGGRGALGI